MYSPPRDSDDNHVMAVKRSRRWPKTTTHGQYRGIRGDGDCLIFVQPYCSHLLRASALGGKWVKYLNWMKQATTTTTTTMEVMVEGESPGDRCSPVNDNREVIRFQRCRRSVPLGQLITSHQRTTAEL